MNALPLALALLLTAVASAPAQGASRNLVPNSDFEEGFGQKKSPEGWIPYPYAQFNQAINWVDGGFKSLAAIEFRDPPVNCMLQASVGAVKPAQSYVVRARIKVEAREPVPFGLGPNVKVIQQDAKGNAIIYPDKPASARHAQIQIHAKTDTTEWQEIEGRFLAEAEASRLQVLLQAGPAFKGRVLFDQVSVTEATDDTRKPGAWLEKVFTDYMTPHIPWASPLAGGPLKVFCLLNNQGKREVVELGQRLEMDLSAVVTVSPSELGLPSAVAEWSGSAEAEKLAEVREKLKREEDVYVIGNAAWNKLPMETRYDVFKRASEGKGLVFVYQQEEETDELKTLRERRDPSGAEWILSGLPADSLRMGHLTMNGGYQAAPGGLRGAVATARIGKGRAVFLDYPYPLPLRYKGQVSSLYTGAALCPLLPFDPETVHQYEYYQLLLIRSMLWAAGREPGCMIRLLAQEGRVGDSPLQVAVANAPAASLRLWHRLLSAKGMVLHEGTVPVVKDRATLRLGWLPAADFTLETRLLDANGAIHASQVFPFPVRGEAQIEKLEVNRSKTNQGTLSGQATLTGPAPAKLRLQLVDLHGRLVLDEQVTPPASGPVPFEFRLPDRLVARLHTLRVALLDSQGGTLALDSATVPVSLPPRNDVDYYVWSGAVCGAMPAFFMNRYCKEKLGMDFYEPEAYGALSASLSQPDRLDTFHFGTMLALTVDQLSSPYMIPVLYRGNSLDRKPCLNDPGYRATFRQIVGAGVRSYYGRGVKPPVYTLGDEFLLTFPGGPDVCFARPTQERFREWLRAKYGDLGKLNASWTTSFKQWEEVSPITLEDARKQSQPGRWLDHRLHMDAVIVDLLDEARRITRETDPEGRIGFEGMFRSHSECGYDLERVSELCDFLVSYEYPYRWEMLASFRRPGVSYGVFSNSLGGSKEGTRYQVWKAIAHGLNSIWWWRQSGQDGFLGFDCGVGSRPAKFDAVQVQAAQVAEARRGIARLLHGARRADQQVAILHSQTSLHMSKYLSDAAALSGAWGAWQYVLEDLGYGYRYVKSSDLEGGSLSPESTRALVLPYAVCLPDKVAVAIRNYTAAGGTVIADVWPTVLDAHGRPLKEGLLDDVFGVRRGIWQPLARQDSDLGPISLDVAVQPLAKATASRTANGHPFAIQHAFGKGKAVLFNFDMAAYGAKFTANDFSLAQFKADFQVNPAVARLVKECLGLKPLVGIAQPGANQPGIEQFVWEKDGSRLVCLVRKFYGETYNQAPTTFPVYFGEKAHVYDVRAGRYLGLTDHAQASLKPSETLIYALFRNQPSLQSVKAALSKNRTIQLTGQIGGEPHDPIHHVLRIEVVGPGGEVLDWYGRNATIVRKSFSLEIPLALNDPVGEWTLHVRDIATGQRVRTGVTVR